MERINAATPIWLFVALCATSILLGVLSSLQPVLVGAMMLGVPFIGMVLANRKLRRTGIILMLALVPLTGILKAITGTRFAPLTFDLGIFLACITFFVEDVRHGHGVAKLDLAWGFLWGLAFLQMFNPNVPSIQAGIEGFRKFTFMSITFYVGRHIARRREMMLFQYLLWFLSIPISLYGAKQFFFVSALDSRMIDLSTSGRTTYLMGGQLRPFSTLPGPFHLGLYLVVVILLAFCWMMYTPQRLTRRISVLTVLLLQVSVLFFTRTKGNWVGLIVGIVVLMYLNPENIFHKIHKLIFPTFLIGVAIGLLLTISKGTASKVQEEAIFAVTHPTEAPTLIHRQQLWQELILPSMLKSPLIGYGTSSATEGLSNLYEGTHAAYFPSHNLYFKIFLEFGVLGFLLFILIVGVSLRRGLQRLRKSNFHNDSRAMVILHWSFAVEIAFLVSGLVIPVLDAYPVNYYFWLLLGVLSASHVTYTTEADAK